MRVDDAAEWFRRGQQALASDDVGGAVDAFRRAAVRNRTDRSYQLALARALVRNHDNDAARALLLSVRESDPEDAEVNLELARIAAGRMDVTEAARFYHNTLYAPWTVDRADARRAVRLELIRFLLAHRQQARAIGELMALTSDLPDRPDAHLEAGRLFADAGDDPHALDQFERAVRAAPDDAAALGAAGEAAFRLGQYPLARTYLRRASAGGSTLEVVEHVLRDDPLANRIGSAERRRRLLSNLEYLQQRSSSCPLSEGPAVDALAANRAPDQDAIESGVELAGRAAQEIAERCPPATGRDRALALIARQHGAEAR